MLHNHITASLSTALVLWPSFSLFRRGHQITEDCRRYRNQSPLSRRCRHSLSFQHSEEEDEDEHSLDYEHSDSSGHWNLEFPAKSFVASERFIFYASVLRGDFCQMQKSIKLLLLDASFSWLGIIFLFQYYVWHFGVKIL